LNIQRKKIRPKFFLPMPENFNPTVHVDAVAAVIACLGVAAGYNAGNDGDVVEDERGSQNHKLPKNVLIAACLKN
jgi:isocitrate dehydrogenase